MSKTRQKKRENLVDYIETKMEGDNSYFRIMDSNFVFRLFSKTEERQNAHPSSDYRFHNCHVHRPRNFIILAFLARYPQRIASLNLPQMVTWVLAVHNRPTSNYSPHKRRSSTKLHSTPLILPFPGFNFQVIPSPLLPSLPFLRTPRPAHHPPEKV